MLSLRIERLGYVTVIHCAGRVAFPHAGELQTVIRGLRRAQSLVLDLVDVIEVDAAGLGALVSLRAYARESGMILKLMNVTPRVEKLFRLTHLTFAFEVCSAREMLDLLCRAIHKDESAPLQRVANAGELTSDQPAAANA